MADELPLSPNGLRHAILDANVLLPPRLSDILFDLCLVGLFHARWTPDIEEEFLRNWLRVVARTDSNATQLSVQQTASAPTKARTRLMRYQSAVPDYLLAGYDDASVLSRVPCAVDAGDRHVAAAALTLQDYVRQFDVASRVCIVLSNLKRLAPPDMKRLGVDVLTPGKFIDSLTKADSERVGQAPGKSVSSLKNPPYTRERLLAALQLHGAKGTVRHFANAWGEKIPSISPR